MANPEKQLTPTHRKRLEPWLPKLLAVWDDEDNEEPGNDCPLCAEARKRHRASARHTGVKCDYCPVFRDESKSGAYYPCGSYMPTDYTEDCDHDRPRIVTWLKRAVKRCAKKQEAGA